MSDRSRSAPASPPRRRLVAPLAAACVAALVAFAPGRTAAAPTTVFFTDFESGLPPEMTAPGSVIEPVQGYAGLGPPGYTFGGNFLRYTSVPLYDTKLVLRNLPRHERVNLRFLLALIDSWDGTELFQVRVDGALLFSHWFQLATGDTSDYPPPPGAMLSAGHDLGFSNGGYWFRDRAYNLAVEPAFVDIPHTADSLDVTWTISAVAGPAASQWQGGSDESWAIDGVGVDIVHTVGVGDESGAAVSLALEGARPNPATGARFAVHFALGESAPATLELMDVAGRRVAAREVGSLGAGRHVVNLAGPGRLAPGVYLVSLRQGARRLVSRAVVLD